MFHHTSPSLSQTKVVLFSLSVLCLNLSSIISHAQAKEEKFIKVYGKVLNQKDSTTIESSVSYEKLPYYDDVGTGFAGVDGEFEFYLINETKYSFTASKNGFKPATKEVEIVDPDGDGLFLFTMYMEPGVQTELISLDNLIFDRGAAVISKSSYKELDDLADWLKEKPNTIIQLEGHTDFAGNAAANMRLSEARVEAVKEYLVKQKVKKDRVRTKAFGGTQPITTLRTPEARTKNRRVEVRIIQN